ncbi:MAG: tyrosine--tRNA ligase, partial [Patescibacteria group bacterium]
MTISEDLSWRGQIKDKTFDNLNWLDDPKTFYLGVDCSSDSLTIGNLAILMVARRLAKAGWKAILLVGGATSLIGDPGGKDEERELKSREEIVKNVAGVQKQVKQIFDGIEFVAVDNYDWFKNIGYLDFLREVGKNFSMTELMQRDFIVSRMGDGGNGISYAEFSYSLIQGYDFWHLFKNHGAVLQIGGSDQWGNMLSGVLLVRKKENAQAHALSTPLIIDKSTGKKFGKSENGAVWLDPNKTSVYQFYQFWLNTTDKAAEEHLKIFTEISKEEVESIIEQFNVNKSERLAQKTLAYEVTKIVHGNQRADSIKKVTEVLFGGEQYTSLDQADFEELKGELPLVEAENKIDIVEALNRSGLASSNSEARRFLGEGGI